MKLGKSDDLQTQMLADWQSRRNSSHLAVWGLFRGGVGGGWGEDGVHLFAQPCAHCPI